MTILQKIVETKKLEISKLKNKILINQIRLKPIYKIKVNKFFLISELKPKSPSSGIIRENFDFKKVIKEFENYNASAISVLTDEEYFGGNIKLLKEVSIITKLPILRKDFIIDKIQIKEAYYSGADIILLIVKILNSTQILEFLKYSIKYGLSIIVEVNTASELQITLDIIKQLIFLPNQIIIGVNNRNLETFEVDIANSLYLSSLIPSNLVKISLSGISTFQDLESIKNANYNGVLIGQGLVDNKDLCQKYFQ
jgi:indole-3-glycerol phosphate synthase